MKTYKDQSREGWYSEVHQKSATHEQIQTGCFQRIADATEIMAQNYVALQNKVKSLEQSLDYARNTRDEYIRKCSALKGVITKLKKR